MNSIIQQRDWRQALEWELDRYNWDYFGTGTFRKLRNVTEARTLVEQYFADLQERLQNPLPRFWVLEPHKYRETVHLHYLLAKTKQINEDVERVLWNYWQKITKEGRFQSREYNANKGGAGYMIKYLTKEVVDWDLANLDKLGTFEVDNSLLNRERLDKMMREELDIKRVGAGKEELSKVKDYQGKRNKTEQLNRERLTGKVDTIAKNEPLES